MGGEEFSNAVHMDELEAASSNGAAGGNRAAAGYGAAGGNRAAAGDEATEGEDFVESAMTADDNAMMEDEINEVHAEEPAKPEPDLHPRSAQLAAAADQVSHTELNVLACVTSLNLPRAGAEKVFRMVKNVSGYLCTYNVHFKY